ncbi:MAG: glucokinase [Polyangiaceae bacterium]|nr:glucokinase [Polyangiaceae bacterium]
MVNAKKASSILVGDIGGTNTRLRLADPTGKRVLVEAVYPSREFDSFEDVARPFLASADAPHPKAAVVGIAGPVTNGVAKVTNLPWVLDEKALAKHLKIDRFILKNDLVVVAKGCLASKPESLDLLTEKGPSPKGKNCAVIAAGTGLGEAKLLWDGEKHLAFATEGGHGDFAPQSPLEIELWHFLKGRYPDHVSYERVISGDGLGALYDFFASRGGREPQSVKKKLMEGDRNAAIAELGLTHAHRPASRAVDLFVALYGAEAGNMALRELALGGVYLAGNIAKRIVMARKEIFMEAFLRKGRFASLLRQVPVAVVNDSFVGVRGALAFAKDFIVSRKKA